MLVFQPQTAKMLEEHNFDLKSSWTYSVHFCFTVQKPLIKAILIVRSARKEWNRADDRKKSNEQLKSFVRLESLALKIAR